MGGRRRRQAEAVTVMAMTLTQGGPCTNEIRESERSGRFDRKRAAIHSVDCLLFVSCNFYNELECSVTVVSLSETVHCCTTCSSVARSQPFPRFCYRAP
ncbi:hypothetical protein SVAN01_02584 [Stagonosporopsis vannaccii]|nr:hypothetical protein SVAN01_02584 [Stagonosporopsis vannaccii]